MLQCGAFILVPGITFGLGLWLIVRYLGFQHRLAMMFFALLMGIVFFEGSIIGMVIDPRSSSVGWTKLFTTAGLIGIGTTLFVLIFTPIYITLIKIFKR
jgi:hypothetical protein